MTSNCGVCSGTTADQQENNRAFHYSIWRTRVAANCWISGV